MLHFGHYESDEEGEHSWLEPDFSYRIEITGTGEFIERLDTNRIEMIGQINEQFKKFEHDYKIAKHAKEDIEYRKR
jgi:hypothetical protein